MLSIPCPHCGERDQAEFAYGGEAHRVRPAEPATLSDAEWADYVFMRTNTKGVFAERWCHAAGCRKWFNALRDTTTDELLVVYPMGEAPPRLEPAAPALEEMEPAGVGETLP